MPIKTCSCGCEFFEIPAGARYFTDPDFAGWYFDCACRSTLFIPVAQGAA